MRFEEIGHLGGLAERVTVSDDHAYVQQGYRSFIVADISDPHHPRQIGASHLIPDGIRSIAAAEHYLLIGDETGHLLIFDISDAAKPTIARKIDIRGQVWQILIIGSTAYLAAGESGLVVLDLTVAGGPDVRSNTPVKGDALSVAWSEGIVVVASREPGPDDEITNENGWMTIFDINSSIDPVLLSTTYIGVYYRGERIQILEGYVRFSSEAYAIADPKTPRLVTDYSNLMYTVPEVVASDYGFQYSRSHWESAWNVQVLYVYDMRTGPRIKQATRAIGPQPDPVGNTSEFLVVRGRYVYVADWESLRIYDLSGDPQEVDRSSQGGPNLYWWPEVGTLRVEIAHRAGECCVNMYEQNLCIIGDDLYSGFGKWSLEQPSAPKLIAETSSTGPRCGGFPTTNGIIYRSRSGMMSYLDMRDPEHPYQTEVAFANDGIVAVVNGSTLYTVTPGSDDAPQQSRFEAYDINDPYNPRFLGSTELKSIEFEWDDQFYVLSRYVFWKNSGGGLKRILDVSDPANIRATASPPQDFHYSAFSAGAEQQNDLVYMVIGHNVEVFRANDLSTAVASIRLPDVDGAEFQGLWNISGNRLFVVAWRPYPHEDTIIAIDISDPMHMKILAQVTEEPFQIVAYGDTVFVDRFTDGVSIYRLVPD